MDERKKPLPHITPKNAPPPYDEFLGDQANQSEYFYFVDGDGRRCADRIPDPIPFRPKVRDFDLVNAWWLCEAATLVYSGPAVVESIFKEKALLPQVEFLSAGGSNECFIASNDDFAIVAFRGSELTPRAGSSHKLSDLFDPRRFSDVFADWVRDFTARLEDFDAGAKVHSGFADGVNRLWEEKGLGERITNLSPRKVWLTGHSLGAALATVAAARLLTENRPLDGLYTYGSPRVGNAAFASALDQKLSDRKVDGKGLTYYRFVNADDVVTTVPPPHLSPYKHAGTLEHIDRGGNIREDRTLFDGLMGRVRNLLPIDAEGRLDRLFFDGIPNAIDDHVPTLYSTRIWNAYADM
jgi:triacylglycerol lipase